MKPDGCHLCSPGEQSAAQYRPDEEEEKEQMPEPKKTVKKVKKATKAVAKKIYKRRRNSVACRMQREAIYKAKKSIKK